MRLPPDVRGQLEARKISRHLPPVNRLVDFGCGTGAILASLPAEEKVGVDPIEENRSLVRQHSRAVASLSEIADAWADAVVSNHALEHTLDPLAELREIRRILRAGSPLVIYVPADDWRVNRTYDPDDRDHHLFTWTPLSLGNLLCEAGLLVKDCQVEHHAWPGRLTAPLYRALPPKAFDCVAYAASFALRRRQIVGLASSPGG
jgi:SAM-dependent methyltransferase